MPKPSSIDDDKTYDLELNTTFQVAPDVVLIPALPTRVSGKVLKMIPDTSVVSAIEVTPSG